MHLLYFGLGGLGGMGGFYFDPMYFVFALPGLAVVLIAQFLVKSRYSRYGQIPNGRRITGRMAAEYVLRMNDVTGVTIQQIGGQYSGRGSMNGGGNQLGDHYDPRTKTIYLSQGVCDNASIAAVGIAAHEAGHAVQDSRAFAPLRLRNQIIPACNLGSTLGVPLVIFGAILSFTPLIWLGIGLFSLAVLFQLITLPVEFDASRRALKTIRESALLEGDEYTGAKQMLQAAALTYVGAMLQSLLILLYYLFRFTGNRR